MMIPSSVWLTASHLVPRIRRRGHAALAAAVLSFAGVGHGGTEPLSPAQTAPAPLRIEGHRLVPADGTVLHGGINMIDPQVVAERREGQSPVSMFHEIRRRFPKANLIRVPLHPGTPWNSSEECSGFLNDIPSYLETYVDPLVTATRDEGVYLILCAHFIADYNSPGLMADVLRFATAVAARYGDEPHILLEPFNESANMDDDWSSYGATVAQPCIDVIRGAHADNIICLGSPQWNRQFQGLLASPPADPLGRTALSLHVYPWHFESAIAFDEIYGELLAAFPAVMTEFGYQAGGDPWLIGNRETYAVPLLDYLAAHNVPAIAWVYSATWNPPLLEADGSLTDFGHLIQQRLGGADPLGTLAWMSAGTASATANYGYDGAVPNLVDGDPETSCELNEAPGWIAITLPEPARIAGIRLRSFPWTHGVNYITLFSVDAWVAGEWLEVANQIAGLQASWNEVLFEEPVTATAMRVRYHSAMWAPRVGEVQLLALNVRFDAGGGTVAPAAKTAATGLPYGVLPTPQRDGFLFKGWYADPSFGGTPVSADTVVTAVAVHTLFAKWEPWDSETRLCDPRQDTALSTAGSYDGFFYREDDFNGGPATAVRGTLALTLANPAGRLTAKAALQGRNISFTTRSWSEQTPDGTRRATLASRTGETLDLFVRQNRIWGTLAGGKAGDAPLTFDGSRNRFADRGDAAAATLLSGFRGYYTVSMPPYAAVSVSQSIAAAPQGVGYLAITIGARGSAKVAGVLADGTRVSRSTRLILIENCGETACVPLFAPLYAKKGWVGGLLWLSPRGVVTTDRANGWFVRWEKPGRGADGFAMLLDACGGFYSPAASLAAEYRLTADAAHTYWHAEGTAAPMAMPDAVPVTVDGTHLTIPRSIRPGKVTSSGATTYAYDPVNPANATLSFTARTGIFKGTFRLYYDYEVAGRPQHKTLRVAYSGILVPLRDAVFADLPAGLGHCLVPDNAPVAALSRLRRSHAVQLDQIRH